MPFVAIGGECLFDTTRIIESAVGDCLVVSYANDYVGYLPTREHYGEGGYEPAASMLSESGAEAYVSAAIANAENIMGRNKIPTRSEEHTSELQSLMRISTAVFCLKKKKK